MRYRALKISVFLTQKIKNYQIWKALLVRIKKYGDYLDQKFWRSEPKLWLRLGNKFLILDFDHALATPILD